MLTKIKGKLGFGCMRLPMIETEVDKNEFNKMIDMFIDAGFNYFDTAHGYIEGKSETAIKDCLTSRYKREDFVLADKLSYWTFEKEEDIKPLFESQLKLCGVDYFDFYLFHCMNREAYDKHKKCNSFNIIKELKEQGKIKHIAMSFHDSADFLDLILTEQPYIEAVQLQFNYLDYDDPTVQSKACYDVCIKHKKKIMIMEPVRGGALVNLPEKAIEVLNNTCKCSPASFALRFAASYPDVIMVLSGMGNTTMMAENIQTFNEFKSLNEEEMNASAELRNIIRESKKILCTKCNYCAEVCSEGVPISELFEIYNELLTAKVSKTEYNNLFSPYKEILEKCKKCGKCENNCPQNIKILELLEKAEKVAR